MALTDGETILVQIDDASHVGEACRAAPRVATERGLDQVVVERVAIVASEAARDVLVHGRGGALALRALPRPPGGVANVALDRGDGIPEAAAARRDGHSSAALRAVADAAAEGMG